jgi:hypothetical protein
MVSVTPLQVKVYTCFFLQNMSRYPPLYPEVVIDVLKDVIDMS